MFFFSLSQKKFLLHHQKIIQKRRIRKGVHHDCEQVECDEKEASEVRKSKKMKMEISI